MSHPQDFTSPVPTSWTTCFFSVTALGSGWAAKAQELPGSTWLAILGTFGSMAVPLLVAIINRSGNRAVVERDLQIKMLKGEADERFVQAAIHLAEEVRLRNEVAELRAARGLTP